MRGNTSVCWLQKDGSTAGEYEDAYSLANAGADPGELDPGELPDTATRLRLGVADGATESMLSGRWARLLVREFTTPPTLRMPVCIERAWQEWPASLERYKREREEAGRPIMWYEEPGLERGAHATLLVAEFDCDDGKLQGRWSAEAVGDSCLFHVRDDELVTSFPLHSSSQFNTSPDLVHTRILDPGLVARHGFTSEGDWHSGDSFFLCTDALASWFIAEVEAGTGPWSVWREFHSPDSLEEFEQWVTAERGTGRLKNDDVTLIYLQFD